MAMGSISSELGIEMLSSGSGDRWGQSWNNSSVGITNQTTLNNGRSKISRVAMRIASIACIASSIASVPLRSGHSRDNNTSQNLKVT
jgi:hypothetical protein